MQLNSLQGHTCKFVGIDLNLDCFSHGQYRATRELEMSKPINHELYNEKYALVQMFL